MRSEGYPHKWGACRSPVLSAGEKERNHLHLLFWALYTTGDRGTIRTLPKYGVSGSGLPLLKADTSTKTQMFGSFCLFGGVGNERKMKKFFKIPAYLGLCGVVRNKGRFQQINVHFVFYGFVGIRGEMFPQFLRIIPKSILLEDRALRIRSRNVSTSAFRYIFSMGISIWTTASSVRSITFSLMMVS